MHPDLADYGPIRFHSDPNALYDRHLLFDYAIDPDLATARERYEAVARSLRDVLALRWLRTKKVQYKMDPKRAYYLSMEFLIGRSLASNVSNLLLDPAMLQACREKNVDWYELLEQEPDAGLGNGGLGRLAACFIESTATLDLPAMGDGLRYEYGIFKQTIKDGWQNEQPDRWLRRPDPWEVVRLDHIVEVKLACSFEIRGGSLAPVPGKPSTLLGFPSIAPSSATAAGPLIRCGSGPPARPTPSNFTSSVTAISSARSLRPWRRSPSPACFTLTTPRNLGRNCASCRSIFCVPVPSTTSSAASAQPIRTGTCFPKKSPFS
jgi:glucan phosphorylase